MIEAIAPTLPAKPCTAPCMLASLDLERIANSDGHMTPLPSASNAVPA